MITIQVLPSDALYRIGEIDRSEDPKVGYVQDGEQLAQRPVNWHIPRWSLDPMDGFSVQVQIDNWLPVLLDGGILVGALQVEQVIESLDPDPSPLLGFAILHPQLSPSISELAALFVDRKARRQGIGGGLLDAICDLARQAGDQWLYVSSVPSEAAVGFYLSQGFKPTSEVNQALFRRKPTDIHLVKDL